MCLIIGLASIAGFLVDFTVAALPPQPLEATWQLEIVRLAADRSLVWLIGLGATGLYPAGQSCFKAAFFPLLFASGGDLSAVMHSCLPEHRFPCGENANQNISQQASQTLEQLQAVQS